MAFKLTKNPRLHKRDYFDESGSLILSLTYREMTQDEKSAHDLEIALIRNHPKLSDEEKEAARKEQYRKVAEAIIVDWDGPEDDFDEKLEPTPANIRDFTLDPESLKFWFTYVYNYLNPWVSVGKVEGEKRLDPRS